MTGSPSGVTGGDVRYLGSKASALPALERLLNDRITSPGTLCDPFGGVGVVGAHFRALGWTVHSSDLLHCAHHFQVARLMVDNSPLPNAVRQITGTRSAEEFIAYLNALDPIQSWVHEEFSLRRKYFTESNATKIDAVRNELRRLTNSGALTISAAAYYSACLIDSVDKVANTAGTYYAHLKAWTPKALHPFSIRLLEPVRGPRGNSAVGEATQLVKQRHWDILYLDPPYNRRDYAAYYHLPETLATGRQPLPQGRSGVDAAPRPYSPFSSPRNATSAMQLLLTAARFRLLILHYSDNGLIPPAWLRDNLCLYGKVEEYVIEATGYSSTGHRDVKHRLYVVQS